MDLIRGERVGSVLRDGEQNMFGESGPRPIKILLLASAIGIGISTCILIASLRTSQLVNEDLSLLRRCDQIVEHVTEVGQVFSEDKSAVDSDDFPLIDAHLKEARHLIDHLIGDASSDSCELAPLELPSQREVAVGIREHIDMLRSLLAQSAVGTAGQAGTLPHWSAYAGTVDMIESGVAHLETSIWAESSAEVADTKLIGVGMTGLELILTVILLFAIRNFNTRQIESRAILASQQDELRRSVQDLRSEAHRHHLFQFALDTAINAVAWTTVDQDIIYVNNSACHLLGRSAEEIKGMKIADFCPSFPLERYQELWRSLRGVGSLVLTAKINTTTGEKPIELHIRLIRHGDQEFAVTTAVDRSEIEFVHQNLEESQRQYREVVDSVDVGIGLVDSEERFVFANRKAEEIFGLESGKLSGCSLAQFLHPAQFLACKRETEKRAKGFNNEYNIEIMRPTGEIRIIRLNAKPRTLDDGTFIGTFGVFEDITDKLQISEERQQLEDRLHRAEKMESLGLLAGGVAHDLNNMLGPLVGYPEMIIRKLPEDSPVIKWVKKIEKSAELAADVIQDLLTLARRGRYQMKPTNVNEVLKDYIDSGAFARVIERNPGITFTANLDPRIGLIDGSAVHLSKAFMNIIQNALEATESGGSVSVSTTRCKLEKLSTGFETVEKGEYIAVKVVDTGVGIPPEEIAKIFEPYFSKKKMGASGSGLGLAVVYGVVKDHKGYYDVISEVGKGTEFILYFPVTSKLQESDFSREQVGNIGTLRVLVVSDDPDARELHVAMLLASGLLAETTDPDRAIEVLQNSSFDCGVIDVPQGKAQDIAERVRAKREAGISTPFLFLADNTESADHLPQGDHESGQVLRKPCKPSVMVESIHALVIKERAAELQKELAPGTAAVPSRV